MQLVDSHVHIDDERLAADLPEVLARARRIGIIAQVIPATHADNWQGVRTLSTAHDDLFPCYGLHPCFMSHHQPEHLHELAYWLGREPCVAVGECGLDYSTDGLDKSAQQRLFAGQLSLAREFRLPVIIHAYKAVEDVIRMVRASGHYNGVVHSFNGSLQQATRLIDLGYKLGFGGALTYPRATRLQELIKSLPLESLVIETDAPYQPANQYNGERNEPAYLIEVLNTISELKNVTAEDIARVTTDTAIELFKLPVLQAA